MPETDAEPDVDAVPVLVSVAVTLPESVSDGVTGGVGVPVWVGGELASKL